MRQALAAVLILALSAAPVEASAQQRAARVGFLFASKSPSPTYAPVIAALRKLGYEQGKNLQLEVRYAEGRTERLPGYAAELVRLKPDLIVTNGSETTLAMKAASSTIPIVFTVGDDPVRRGLVRSYARPGANLTGFVLGLYEDKQLELLKEALPGLKRVARLWDANLGPPPVDWPAARALGLQASYVPLRTPGDIDAAIAAAARARPGALLVANFSWIGTELEHLAVAANRHRLPAIGFDRRFAAAGGLMYFGPKRDAITQQVAAYIDLILRGAKPGDLPVQAPTRFELVINEKTARALRLKLPKSVYVRADEVLK